MGLTQLEEQLKESAQWSLDNHLVSNAVFLAERLNSETSTSTEDRETKLHFLAECYMAEQNPHKVTSLLKGANSHGNRYLYALACFKTNNLSEGEKALTKTGSMPNGAAGYYLLGQICEKLGRISDAKNYFAKALQLNPVLWTAYEKLCKMGYAMDAGIFSGDDSTVESSNRPDPENVFQPLSVINQTTFARSPSHSTEKSHFHSQKELGEFLSQFGRAYQSLTRFETEEALEAFRSLDQSQQDSGWVLCQMAKCYFESYDFITAIEYFQKAYKNEPQRIDDIDVYSSALWYEKRGTDLCYLLHSALKKAYHFPQTWVVAGNFYSFQKERETAIKCLTRAIQINPSYSYAYSLCGHEYLAIDDFEHAKN